MKRAATVSALALLIALGEGPCHTHGRSRTGTAKTSNNGRDRAA